MKSLPALIFILFSVSAFGQATDSIQIVKKEKKYYLAETCYDFLKWEEVLLKDKSIEKKINSHIEAAALSYQFDSVEKELIAERCKGEMEYDVECKVLYAKNNLVSYLFTSYLYFKGAAHGERKWQVDNFDTKTGKVIYFRDIINREQKTAFEDFLLQRLKARLQITDDSQLKNWKGQLANPNYELSDKGITIDLIGDSYATSVIDVFLTYEELKPFINIQGHLEPFYNK